MFVSHKIEQDLKLREAKPPAVNQECLVYKFKCDLCETGYVIYQTRGRVFHPISKHREVVEKKKGAAEFFLTNFKVFGYQMKHPFECLI